MMTSLWASGLPRGRTTTTTSAPSLRLRRISSKAACSCEAKPAGGATVGLAAGPEVAKSAGPVGEPNPAGGATGEAPAGLNPSGAPTALPAGVL